MKTIEIGRVVIAGSMALALGACSIFSSNPAEYEPVNEQQALEVPPELDAPNTSNAVRVPDATYSRVAGGPVSERPAPVASGGNAAAGVDDGQRVGLVWSGGVRSLRLADSEEGAWRRVGFALERIGLSIDERERDRGTYVVEYVDHQARENRPGVFSRWILRRKGPTDHSGTYQVRLRANGEFTDVSLYDEAGSPADEVLAEEILSALQERLS